ncbi:Uncharacterized protein ToN1_27110 [Aromatoleum petrolei]|nr:Uncharacterized protein ToN1_27110 [Aromatoleum petrolei]
MLAEPSKRQATPETAYQRVCIDLPGEAVRCWRSNDKVEVILRKHRDVILQFKMKAGSTYTVESEPNPVLRAASAGRPHESILSQRDFYNARDKKLVEARLKQKVHFQDGEQLHLWVGREFNGVLLVKRGDEVAGRFEPNVFDAFPYGSDPKTKPAPMIVVVDSTTPDAGTSRSASGSTETMHVLEVRRDLGSLPDDLADFFKKGGEETAIDTRKLMTRNWLWAQITGAVAFFDSNKAWIRELWAQKFLITKVKDKAYIIFKGNHKLREHMKGTRYLSENSKIIAISAGAGTLKGAHKAAWDASKGSFKGAPGWAVMFTIGLDVAEWLADYEARDPTSGRSKRDFFDLGAKIFTDVAWAALGAWIGSFLVAGLSSMWTLHIGAALGAGAILGGVVIIGAVLVAIGVGLGLAWFDARLGVTQKLAHGARAGAAYLDAKFSTDYHDYQSSVDEMLLRGMP